MIATRQLPAEYQKWNRRHHAPFGRFGRILGGGRLKRMVPVRVRGPFGVQINNSIREFEYAWAAQAVPIEAGMRVADIGGGLGGLQFVLDREGCKVVNVDPGEQEDEHDWVCKPAAIDKLNRIFGTQVELRNTTAEQAGLEASSFDVVYSISVLEHLEWPVLETTMWAIHDCLKPGGHVVLTVDLMLDLAPFTSREVNHWGSNVNVRALTQLAPFELVDGKVAELNGFPEFDTDAVQSRLGEFMIGTGWPSMAQCLVLRKPAD